jgi:hypothetical protein
MTYYIGSARHNEFGKAVGGKRGDQNGGLEVSTQKMYNYPSKGGWIALRPKADLHARAIRDKMVRLCANDAYGYGQDYRYDIIKRGIDTTIPSGCDCSSSVRACVKEATGVDPGDFTTANEVAVLMATGLFTKVGTVTTLSKLYEGDILVTRFKGHTAVVTSGHSRAPKLIVTSNDNVKVGQNALNQFVGAGLNVDGSCGPATKKAMVKAIQRAINLDYGKHLAIDGSFGPATKAALNGHYVAKGETQYLVTAAEIITYCKGKNPNGIEMPGHFGKGLQNATGYTKLNASWFAQQVK